MDNVIGFVGYECEDIVIYLAKILQALGKNIAVVDRTEQELLCEIFELRTENEITWKEGEYSGFLITNRGVCQEEYDLVFYLFGYRLNHPKLYECGTLIMITDGLPAHASLLRNIKHGECSNYLLIRNLVPMKHTEEYLAALAGQEKEYFELFYDEQDIRSRCSLGVHTGCEIRRLSIGMKRVLFQMVCHMISECEEKRIWKLLKKI